MIEPLEKHYTHDEIYIKTLRRVVLFNNNNNNIEQKSFFGIKLTKPNNNWNSVIIEKLCVFN